MPDPSTLSDTAYARKRRELFEIARDLQNMGADANFDVPRIAVIGGQSTGKSSLVEAVTGIKVPRDSGTCTKCPMDCSVVTSSTSWSCQISLRINNSEDSGHSTRTFSPLLSSKTEVEIWIRRAQTAILSPHKSPNDFLQSTYDELKQLTTTDSEMLKFSKNVVVVRIEDPHGTDLYFIDLPGLIQNADPEVIGLVRGLVQDYIKDPSTIILVTVPATDDLENQEAMRLARETDPEGSRTIGIVTKPDAIPAGSSGLRKQWHEIFKGQTEAHRLQLGYYCVRLPDDDQRNGDVSRKDTDRVALQFFQSTAPWKDIMHLRRFGIPNVVSDISKVLMGIIHKMLPTLQDQIQQSLDACIQDLEKLPQPRKLDVPTEILSRITEFCTDLQDLVDGRSEDKSFVHRCQAMFRWFKLAIRRSAPDFRPFSSPGPYFMPPDPEPIEDLGNISPDYTNLVIPTPQPRDLYNVRQVIKQSTGWELPHNVPYEAKTRLYEEFLASWVSPARVCFERIAEVLLEFVNLKITAHFGRFQALEQHFGAIIRTEVKNIKTRSLCSLHEVLTRESSPHFTQNDHYLESSRGKWLAHYKLIRCNAGRYRLSDSKHHEELPRDSSPGMPETEISIGPSVYAGLRAVQKAPINVALEALSELGYKNLTKADLERLHPPDDFEEELEVMADVRAYFQVSYKRIIDNVPMTIQHTLNRALAQAMQNCLVAELHLGTSDASERLEKLLVEDPGIEAKRMELEKKRARLLEIQVKLINFHLPV